MIIVTGGAGFIGSNLVRALNARGWRNLIVVDDLTQGEKFSNLVGCAIADYQDKDAFMEALEQGQFSGSLISAVFHQGACTDTTEWNGRLQMEANYTYSKRLLQFCLELRIPFIYASSAAVYGAGQVFREEEQYEAPLNVYGYSKHLFDQMVRRCMERAESQVVGLRYFNVYGPREAHKGDMASVAYKLDRQLKESDTLRLFGAAGAFGPGEQRRDFVHVDDVVATVLWFHDHPEVSGIYNVGTGHAQSFNEVAQAVIDFHGRGHIEYIPFPQHLIGRYQDHTEADLTRLRQVGCPVQFRAVAEGVADYLRWLNA